MNHQTQIKRPSPSHKNDSENRMYYEKLANQYHMIQYLPIFFLIILVVLTVFFGYRSMRGDNFRYLLKTLKDNPVSLGANYENISYAAGSGVDFTLFKDDLAVIGDGRMTLYTLSGDLRFRHNAKNTATAYAVSEKYIAVYTPGAKGLSVYNSFGNVFEHTFKQPIRSIAVSDSGRLAVCLKGEDYTEIEIFDVDFNHETSFRPENGVVYDMDISPNGDKLVVTVLATVGGAYYTEMICYDISGEKVVASEKIDGKKPTSTGFFADGRFYVAVQGTIFFYQSNGKKTETVAFSAQEYAAICDGKTLSVLKNASHVTTYSAKGNLLAEFSLSRSVFSMKYREGTYYTVSDTEITLYSDEGEDIGSYPISSGLIDFFILADGSLLLCYVTETNRIIPFS